MTTHLDPLAASAEIVGAYQRYVKTFVDVREPDLAAAFGRAVDEGNKLTKGPLLEATPAYQQGASIRELITAGILDPGFASFDGPGLPLDRALYRHQEEAIRKVVAGRNVVVTTGTGSGKTESFLIPILNHLAKERTSGKLGPGVRALLLYPMNALANDQVKRLRQLLTNQPDITFGRYTGETRATQAEAEKQFRALNPGVDRIPNELISREAMQAAPPNILLTNYAMLEYLLLRPTDLVLFESSAWTFLALDEAHVYDGAKGAEIALLLRRLHDRVAPGRALQCIATSASVVGPHQGVMRFASSLFGADFVWRPDSPDEQDLVTASRVTNPEVATWGPMSPEEIGALPSTSDCSGVLVKLARQHGFDATSGAEALHHEASVIGLRACLKDGPLSVQALALSLWPDAANPQQVLDDLVRIASAVRDEAGNPVLSARYHLFVRATEGAFTCLSTEGPHVHLDRHELCPDCDSSCFEFGACRRCGAVYLVGSVQRSGNSFFFRPSSQASEPPTWLILGDNDEIADEDDDTLDTGKGASKATAAKLCVHCGLLNTSNSPTCSNCGGGNLRAVRRYERTNSVLASCAACGARSGDVIRRLNMGSDAPPSVLTTALYQKVPTSADADPDLRGEGRKLLLFSDSRQAAAFAAPYLQNTYSRLQERRLIVAGLDRARRLGNEIGYRDLLFHTVAAAGDAGFFERNQTSSERERMVALWIMLELVSMDHRQSLEGLGLVAVTHQPPILPAAGLLLKVGLNEKESWDLIEELVRIVRQQGVLTMPNIVAANDDRFSPRVGPIFMRGSGSEPRRKVLSWSPTKGINRRIDFVRRVLQRTGSAEDPGRILTGAWGFVDRLGLIQEKNLSGLGVVAQVNHECLRFEWGESRTWFRCSLCRRISSTSVRGVCPNLGCEGDLEPFTLPDANSDDQHYRRLYRTLRPVPMTAIEHTAQWTSERAAEIQQEFVDGKVNVLSCSTTFELGVDVGDLQSVVMRNMPPTTANYVQRAGRAGRRADSAALVLTYAQRRSHDLSRFQAPEKMITGSMRIPFVPLENERIGRRHAHSIALSSFFRDQYLQDGSNWREAGQFFIPGPGATTAPVDSVEGYLSPVPDEINESLRRVLPESIQREIGVEDGKWVSVLVELLMNVRADINADVDNFNQRREEAAAERKYGLAEQMQKTITTIVKRNLLGYLGNRNVLPKYGFPVDTVELRTIHSGDTAGRQLELSRDLAQAIYDYAPGNQVIAGGKRWTSAGVHRLPGRELIAKKYRVCTHCDTYAEGPAAEDDTGCPSCKEPWVSQLKEYLVPEFGFVAERQPDSVGTAPPERRWHGSTSVQALGTDITERTWTAPDGQQIKARAGARGRLVAVSEGLGGGFWICSWCGWGRAVGNAKPPARHTRPTNGKDCSGFLSRRSLGHSYETDMVELVLPGLSGVGSEAEWRSALYAVLEGACEALEISRDDMDGSLYRTETGARAIVLFDTVPGGAGGARLVAESLETVVRGALDRVDNCECGPETSCYACLRGYRNGRYHDELSRTGALTVLEVLRPKLIPDAGAAEALPPEWQDLVECALSEAEAALLIVLATLGVPLPEQGYESENGVPLDLAWPNVKLALVEAVAPEPDGWTYLQLSDAEPDDVAARLA